jgi:hypothetical protein
VTFNNVSLSNPNLSLASGQTLTAPITIGSLTGLMQTDYKPPVSNQYSIGVQQEIRPGTVFTASYVGNQNRHQNDVRNINLPSPTLLPSLISGAVNYNTVVPYLGYGQISMSENGENSHYNALQTEVRSQFGKDLQFNAAYTLSRSIDPASSFGGDLANVSNPYNRAYDNGPSYSDRTHIFQFNFIYNLPVFNHSTSRMLKSTLGGWQLSAIAVMETGLPLGISLGGSQGSNGIPGSTNRPNYSGSVSYPQTVAQWFNPSAFSLPTSGQWGTLSKGAIRAPGRDNWNMSLFKSFVFNEAHNSRVEFRAESFNTWNHTQFNGISTGFTSSNFGAVTSTWDPRVFQLGIKLLF